uniref:NADH-ubiquinone oxidoreductase chain 2 n=1 Tax=Cyphoderus albinus TaxID=1499079 RepID=A0A6H0EXA0_9HEXA|nr:NADH dehydrogenase subunit 2 [Cyphoderus albinus]QIT06445.1 NADH dehydrogenase subunit 2 [Cyphoderus albinus]
MFIKSYMVIFFIFLVIGTMISVSANNWFTVWLGLEINLMSMIPIMINKLSQPLSEASIKYFITQALASVILIISTVNNMFMNNMINLEMMNLLIIISLLMKSGMAPFHFWFPQVIMNMNWLQSLILFTWQKIAPLILISSSLSYSLIWASALSAMVGAISGLNQTILKLMLTFSSISHSGWMVMACSMNFKLWFLYFSVYSFLIISIINIVWNKYIKINEINFINNSTQFKMSWSSLILSLGGLPPMIGFLSKMMVINKIMFYSLFFVMSFLIFSSLISLYWYLRMIYSSLMIFSKNMKSIFYVNKSQMSLMLWVSTSMNITSPTLLFILT